MTRIYIAIAAVLILVGALYGVYRKGYSLAENEVMAKWAASTIKNAELARKELERVQAKADAEREQYKQEREQKEEAERKRLENERIEAERRAADLLKRYQYALTHKPDCAEQMKQVLACPVR